MLISKSSEFTSQPLIFTNYGLFRLTLSDQLRGRDSDFSDFWFKQTVIPLEESFDISTPHYVNIGSVAHENHVQVVHVGKALYVCVTIGVILLSRSTRSENI